MGSGVQVFAHIAIEEEEQGEIFSTCIDNRQSAFAFILEKCPRMPRGLEVSVKGLLHSSKCVPVLSNSPEPAENKMCRTSFSIFDMIPWCLKVK